MTVESELKRALRNGYDIEIKYKKYGGEISRRKVSNIEESDVFGDGYISGYCHLRDEDRTFRIDRVQSVRVLPSGTWVHRNGSGGNSYSGLSGVSNSSGSYSNSSSSYKPSYSNSSSGGGCYIATMAYGSYDHPQVMVLRWYRDNVLQKRWFGRLFIRIYYSMSPKAVKVLQGHERINAIIRRKLDNLVDRVKSRKDFV